MTFLDEIEARASKATPGPWLSTYSGIRGGPKDEEGNATIHIVETDCGYYPPKENDEDFIIHSRTDIPHLVSALRKAVEMARFYSSEDNWRSEDYLFDSSEINIDEGKKAREFLAWLEGQE